MSESLAAEAAACVGEVEHSEGVLRAELSFPAHLSVFAGHFPGQPIVPAVYLLEAATCAAGRALGRSLALSGVRSAKFTRPLAPGDSATLRAELREVAGELELAGELSVGGEAAAALTLSLRG
ncbi:MAG TPA: 3-hydroxylacyl-ACP dehydratase [Planctomycetes bacterium]|nr:3-hydroxylacyl-ACP dehydratase [Planctomycetota bacterium]